MDKGIWDDPVIKTSLRLAGLLALCAAGLVAAMICVAFAGTLPEINPASLLPVPGPTWTPTATLIPTNVPIPTKTPDVARLKANWGEVDIRDLVKNPDRYIGRQVHYRGEVFRIEEVDAVTTMQVWVDTPGGNEFEREAVIVILDGSSDNIYQGSTVEFWGITGGGVSGVNAFGATVSQPLIRAEYLSYFTE